jgi:hypothetical protein
MLIWALIPSYYEYTVYRREFFIGGENFNHRREFFIGGEKFLSSERVLIGGENF